LEHAALGFPGDHARAAAAKKAKQHIKMERLAQAHLPISKQKEIKQQAFYYSCLVDELHPYRWPGMLAERLAKVHTDYNFANINWEQTRCEMTKLPGFVASAIIKTWLNAWTTARRYHVPDYENIPCVFKCGMGKCDIAHYMKCPKLWTVIADCTKAPIASTFAQRMFLQMWSKEQARTLAVAFIAFHSVKDPSSQHSLLIPTTQAKGAISLSRTTSATLRTPISDSEAEASLRAAIHAASRRVDQAMSTTSRTSSDSGEAYAYAARKEHSSHEPVVCPGGCGQLLFECNCPETYSTSEMGSDSDA